MKDALHSKFTFSDLPTSAKLGRDTLRLGREVNPRFIMLGLRQLTWSGLAADKCLHPMPHVRVVFGGLCMIS